jgi:hypothetical protein
MTSTKDYKPKTQIMKKLFLPIAIVAVFSACNTKKEEDKRDLLFLNDSSSLQSNVSSDTATVTQAAPEPAAPVAQYTAPKAKKAATTYKKPVKKVVTRSEEPDASVLNVPSTNTGTVPAQTGTAGTGTAGTGTVDNTTTIPDKKEGVSKAAKGAVIGGVAGAAAGAILTKKGKGAVIGGVIGAAGGYILGRKKDKADGRVGN